MGSKLYIVLLWRNYFLIAFKFKVKSKWCSENKLWIELGSDLKVSAVISVGKPRLYRTHLTPNRLKSLVIFFGQCVWVRWEATEMWMDILLLCCAYWIYSTYTHIQITNQSELLHKALHWILITDIILRFSSECTRSHQICSCRFLHAQQTTTQPGTQLEMQTLELRVGCFERNYVYFPSRMR